MSEKQTTLPDARGHFGQFGGRYVPEILIPALDELIRAYEKYKRRRGVSRRVGLLSARVCRPSHAAILMPSG